MAKPVKDPEPPAEERAPRAYSENRMKLTASYAVASEAVIEAPGPTRARDRKGKMRDTIFASSKVKGTGLVQVPALTIVDAAKMNPDTVAYLKAKKPPTLVAEDAPPEAYSRVRRGTTAAGEDTIAPDLARAVPIKEAT